MMMMMMVKMIIIIITSPLFRSQGPISWRYVATNFLQVDDEALT